MFLGDQPLPVVFFCLLKDENHNFVNVSMSTISQISYKKVLDNINTASVLNDLLS